MNPGSAQCCPAIGQETEIDAQENPLEHEEEYFYCASDHTQRQGAQRMCGFSLTGDILYLSGCNPMSDALGQPFLTLLGPDDSLWSCQT